ncbi:nucleotide exchange factor GrpE [Candidatus Woesearchaeota archaeon]|nr:nucleotide exchange factor GrpE [Candidatus Woesearchaeota archaeon]
MTKKQTKDQKIKELTETLQRLQADFENYKKIVEKQKEAQSEYASAVFIEKILHILDLFELALKDNKDSEKFKQGVQLIYTELLSILKNEGLKKIESLKKQFDPHYHEAMLAEKSNKETDTIIEVLQEGYMLKDKVIRHAKVKIVK